MKKKFIALGGAAIALAAVSVAHAGTPHWRLVAGTGETPAVYAAGVEDCDVAAVYGYVEETQSWLIWYDVAPELQFLNDDFTMDASSGYWVACKEE